MTANTHKRHRELRRSSMMEALGFIETPSVSHSAPPQQTRPPARSHLVSTTNTPAHTIEELWNTTELRTDLLVDWDPIGMERRLDKRVRWPLIFVWVVVIAIVGAGGFWLWQNRASNTDVAVFAVQEAARDLGDTLDPLVAATETLVAESGPVDEAILLSSGDADDSSRALFSAAADLPGTQSSTRAIATNAATAVLEASGELTRTAAYIGAVTPVLTPPALITNPDLIDLATAATDFGGWRAKFEMMLTRIPDGVISPVTDDLVILGNELESIQTSYLDGLRADDGVAAQDAVRQLEARLTSMWIVLQAETEAIRAEILEHIEGAQAALLSLTG